MGFKEAIQEYGKELSASFTCGGVTYDSNDIVSMNPHYEGSLLRSVMKGLDIELNRSAAGRITSYAGSAIAGDAVAGVINPQDASMIRSPRFGVKAPGDADYSYLEYGTYVVKDKKDDKEQDFVLFECYDLMLFSMVPYDLIVNYPITVGGFLDAICTRLGWEKRYTTFVNSDVEIEEEKYDETYTYRDVLDEIAQVAGGMIAFVGDELDVIYPTNSGETIDTSNLITLRMGESYGPVNSVVLARSPQEDNIYRQNSDSVSAHGITEVRIENNQIMDSHREDFIDGILGAVLGLQFETYELESFGIGYLNLGEFFTIQTPDGENHTALMLCDDLKIGQGSNEISRLEAPAFTETDYTAASESDRVLNKTILRVDKQAQEITALVSKTEIMEGAIDGVSAQITHLTEVMIDSDSVDIRISEAIDGIDSVTTATGYTFDKDGLHIQKTVNGEADEMENLIDNTGMYVKRYGENILAANNEGVDAINLRSRQFLIIGNNSRIEDYTDGRTACFYIGGS